MGRHRPPPARRVLEPAAQTSEQRITAMNLLEAIGNTPLIELMHAGKRPGVRILCKLEGCNPGGSVKDRPALSMISKAEERGELAPGKVILEPTSGNTGIAIAMIGAAKGYRVHLCMPECVSAERSMILQGLGAEVSLTHAREGIDGAIREAHDLLEREPERYYMPNQYENPDNILAHVETTGPEIYEQTAGEVDYFVAGMGTTGTLMGTGRYLRSRKPDVRIVGAEPVMGHAIQGLKNMTESMVPGIFAPGDLDDRRLVNDDEAFDATRMLAREEGLFVGSSSGAAVSVALRIAEEIDSGTIVVLLPDRGDRYLSTMQFRSICGKCPP
jgi:cysteine synthase B